LTILKEFFFLCFLVLGQEEPHRGPLRESFATVVGPVKHEKLSERSIKKEKSEDNGLDGRDLGNNGRIASSSLLNPPLDPSFEGLPKTCDP
jgi:hypothetical protein